MKNRICTRCGKGRNPDRYVGATGRVCDTCRKGGQKVASRTHRLREVYGLEPDEWQLVLDAQGNVCAVCGGARRYELQVDHDHHIAETQGMRSSLRGGLCRRCNKFLRDCHDDISVLEALIAYLRDPPARRVLPQKENA